MPVTLELGGKSPQIVFADADLERALPFLVNAGIQNAGQTCSASSRLLVEQSIYEPLLEKLAARYRALRVGAAKDDLDVGPLISAAQKSRVEILYRARTQGRAFGRRGRRHRFQRAERRSFRGAHACSPAFRPITCWPRKRFSARCRSSSPSIPKKKPSRIANGTDYGLVAGVWTRDGGRAMRLARAVRAGQVFINNYGAGGGVELPFGGVGRSGHGREKGFEALYAFTRLKTVAAFHG